MTNPATEPRPLGTPRDVAKLLNLSIDSVYRKAQRGEIPGQVENLGSRLRFNMTTVEAWAFREKRAS